VCDDEIIPSQVRIENIADDADLEEVYDSERRLLYRRVYPRPRSSVGDRGQVGIRVSG
jgi:hypothetical protein